MTDGVYFPFSIGCITCKSKRLKCDETKPTCQQCRKRSVPCGGYKKDFKWRPFEEATFTNKPAPASAPAKSKRSEEYFLFISRWYANMRRFHSTK